MTAPAPPPPRLHTHTHTHKRMWLWICVESKEEEEKEEEQGSGGGRFLASARRIAAAAAPSLRKYLSAWTNTSAHVFVSLSKLWVLI